MEEKNKTSEKRIKYISNYNKMNYRQVTGRFRLDFYRKVEKYCKKHKLSINALVVKSVQYIIDNKIDINGLD